MASGPAIETPRLVLRRMQMEDALPLHDLFGDPVFMQAFVPFDQP